MNSVKVLMKKFFRPLVVVKSLFKIRFRIRKEL